MDKPRAPLALARRGTGLIATPMARAGGCRRARHRGGAATRAGGVAPPSMSRGGHPLSKSAQLEPSTSTQGNGTVEVGLNRLEGLEGPYRSIPCVEVRGGLVA